MRKIIIAGVFCCLSIVNAEEEFKTPKEIQNWSKPVEIDIEPIDESEFIDPSSPIILDSLRGIWIHRSPNDVVDKLVDFSGIKVDEPSKLTDTAVFKDILNNYIDKEFSFSTLEYLKSELLAYYRKLDYPIVDIVVPEQNITAGVLQLVLYEAKIGKYIVQGNNHFTDKQIINAMKNKEGELPHIPTIRADANWLSDNAFLRVQPTFKEGEQTATTDVFLQVEDRLPLRVYGSYQNTGNDLTGINQFSAGISYSNVWQLGHEINYQFTQAEEFDGLHAHAISYKVPLPWRHTFSANVSITRTQAIQTSLNIEGESDEVSLNYLVPLSPLDGYTHSFLTGFQWKRSLNSLEFNQIPLNNTEVDIAQFSLAYSGQFKDKFGQTSFTTSLVKSAQGLFGRQSQARYQAVRAGSDDNYLIIKLNVNRQTTLPKNWLLINSLNSQLTNENLLSNEQLSATGVAAVRGFDPGTFNSTDNGVVIRNELYAPQLQLHDFDQWRFFSFLDFAFVAAHSGSIVQPNGNSEASRSFSSAGLGLKLKLGRYANINGEYGYQLNDIGGTQHDHRGHIQLSVQY